MSEKNKGLATAADLLALSGGEQEISLKTCGWKIKIKKATVGELSDIMKAVGDEAIEQFVWLAFRCMVTPKMEVNQIKQLPTEVLIEIGTEIAKYSGIDKKSVDRMRNLLEIEPVGQSSL